MKNITVTKMGKYSLIWMVALVFGFSMCSKFPDERKTYYFYYTQDQFKKHEFNSDDSSHISYDIRVPYPTDSFRIVSGGKYYILDHFRNTFNVNDTLFVKHKSVLDTMTYFSKEWVRREENLIEFWQSRMGGGIRFYDSLKIYMIEPIEGTDSLKFLRVHRNYMADTE